MLCITSQLKGYFTAMQCYSYDSYKCESVYSPKTNGIHISLTYRVDFLLDFCAATRKLRDSIHVADWADVSWNLLNCSLIRQN